MPSPALHARATQLLAESERLLAARPDDNALRSEAALLRLWASLHDVEAMTECLERMRRMSKG